MFAILDVIVFVLVLASAVVGLYAFVQPWLQKGRKLTSGDQGDGQLTLAHYRELDESTAKLDESTARGWPEPGQPRCEPPGRGRVTRPVAEELEVGENRLRDQSGRQHARFAAGA